MRSFIDIISETLEPENSGTRDDDLMRQLGGTVVKDAEGRPLLVYHGTGAEFETFRGMVWASVSKRLASEYAQMRQAWHNGNARVVPLYMRIMHPYDANQGGSSDRSVTLAQFVEDLWSQRAPGTDDQRDRVEELLSIAQAGRREEESGPHYSVQDFWYETTSSFGTKGAAAIREMFDLLGFDGIKLIEDDELTFGAFSSEQVVTQ